MEFYNKIKIILISVFLLALVLLIILFVLSYIREKVRKSIIESLLKNNNNRFIRFDEKINFTEVDINSISILEKVGFYSIKNFLTCLNNNNEEFYCYGLTTRKKVWWMYIIKFFLIFARQYSSSAVPGTRIQFWGTVISSEIKKNIEGRLCICSNNLSSQKGLNFDGLQVNEEYNHQFDNNFIIYTSEDVTDVYFNQEYVAIIHNLNELLDSGFVIEICGSCLYVIIPKFVLLNYKNKFILNDDIQLLIQENTINLFNNVACIIDLINE